MAIHDYDLAIPQATQCPYTVLEHTGPKGHDAPRRVAIVHDWLVVYGGAERVLRELLAMFPDAALYAVVDFLSVLDRANLYGKQAITTFAQKLPFAKSHYRRYLPLMPLAIEQLDLSAYDLIISNSHAVAKGVITGPNQTHICYCLTPIRYAWDLQHQYLRQTGLQRGFSSAIARVILHYIRLWDVRTGQGVDHFIAISDYIARRVRKTYGRSAEVLYPPVDLAAFPLHLRKADIFVTAGRMVPYKRFDLIVQAFAMMPDHQLIVIGDGPEMPRVRACARRNVTLLGFQDNQVLLDYLQRARAFITAAEEDFGILTVEAQACGTPVIAFGRGAALETVVGLEDSAGRPATGVFYEAQTPEAIVAAVRRFEATEIDPRTCHDWAARFSTARFHESWRAFLRPHVHAR
jgi:glycosyltransferase involved in cell wall biosynthesis